MSDKPVTLIISDLHVGGGTQDPGDDHVYQNNQLRRFIEEVTNSADGKTGRVELFINGDFLEFAQVRPEVYTLGSSSYWCSESESMEKLNTIIAGHSDIFAALKDFQEHGNQLTLAAGNHDVDLYWGDVQKRLREVTGPVNFATGQDVFTRYDGKLVVGHGHYLDPANSFDNWADPFAVTKKGELRLAMCPGTLFMVKFVNKLEERYKFSDNMKPVTALARVLIKEEKMGFVAAAWSLMSFIGRNPVSALSTDPADPVKAAAIGSRIVDELMTNPAFLARITNLYQTFIDPSVTSDDVAGQLTTDKAVMDFINQLVVKADPDKWVDAFDVLGATTLGSSPNTLSILKAGMAKDKDDLRNEAEQKMATSNAEVVVFGHTHQPDEWRGVDGKSEGGYFNPGSWTRYVDVTDMPKLKLADLENEQDFPYQLNFIRVEQTASGKLRADKTCFEQANGNKFSV
ncbi:MAG TPA: metallophosphoesterase [Pyrinomonadaceae bacterium]|nr:metallophosphoesterase [Pyrinomonadaceae bacterium]